MRSLTLLILLLLPGCSRPALPAGGDPLAREVAKRTAGAVQICVSSIPNQNLRVIDSRTLAYGLGNELWVNRLSGHCPALSPFNSVIVSSSASQYCRGDQVRGLEPGGIVPGPACSLQGWTPYRRQ